MRNVIFANNVAIDGCCDHTKLIGDEEIHEYFTHVMRDVDLCCRSSNRCRRRETVVRRYSPAGEIAIKTCRVKDF